MAGNIGNGIGSEGALRLATPIIVYLQIFHETRNQ